MNQVTTEFLPNLFDTSFHIVQKALCSKAAGSIFKHHVPENHDMSDSKHWGNWKLLDCTLLKRRKGSDNTQWSRSDVGMDITALRIWGILFDKTIKESDNLIENIASVFLSIDRKTDGYTDITEIERSFKCYCSATTNTESEEWFTGSCDRARHGEPIAQKLCDFTFHENKSQLQPLSSIQTQLISIWDQYWQAIIDLNQGDRITMKSSGWQRAF